MILLGVLSHVSWATFLTGLFIFDVFVIIIGFLLDKFVWSNDKMSITKNDMRNRRDDEDDGIDYVSLAKNAHDFVRVKTINDDDFFNNDDSSEHIEAVPSSSDVSSLIYDDDEIIHEQPVIEHENNESISALDTHIIKEDNDEIVSDDELINNNNEVLSSFISDCGEVIASNDDFDADVNFLNIDEEQSDEELHDIVVIQEDNNFSLDNIIENDDNIEAILDAAIPLDLDSVNDIELPSIEEDITASIEEPEFDD